MMSGQEGKMPSNEQLEAALQESEARYQNLVESSPFGIAVHSQEKIVYINPEAIRVMGGQTAADFLGRSIWSFVHPDYLAGIKERIARLYALRQEVGMVEEKFIRLDGWAIDVVVAATPVNYMGVPSAQVAFRDISQRKQAERQLQLSEKRFRSIIEQSVDGIMLTSETGEIVEWNPGMEHITGYLTKPVALEELSRLLFQILPK
jgi:two-component system sporulation sensor kinase A